MNSKRLLIICFSVFSIQAAAQVQLDKQLQLTGSGASDKRVTGLGTPAALTDAVSVANIQNNSSGFATATNAGNAYAVTLPVAPAAYTTGLTVTFKASAANTGPSTLNVNGLGVKTMLKYASVALASNDITASQMVNVIYDGTNFQVLSELNPSGGFTGSLVGDVTGTQSATVIAANSVNSAKIADGSVVNADINTGAAITYSKLSLTNSIIGGDIVNSTVTPAKISAAGAASGQVITYNGTNVVWGTVGGNSIAFNRIVRVATAGNTSYTATSADGIVAVDMSAGTSFTVTLPSGIASGGIIIVKIEKYNTTTFPTLTIQAASGTIDGASNVAFGNAGGNRRLYSDGAGNWYGW